MRKLLLILLTGLFCLPALAEEPETCTDGPWEYTVNEDGTATLTRWLFWTLEDMPEVVEVPATLGGHPVTALGEMAFYTMENDPLPKQGFTLVIPEGVQRCEGEPFACCHEVGAIHLPASLTDLAGADLGPMYHVSAEITIADGNPRYEMRSGYMIDTWTDTLLYAAPSANWTALPAVSHYGTYCLYNWGNFHGTEWSEPGQGATAIIPEGVESMAAYTLFDNMSISVLILPDSLTEIAPHAVESCAITEIQFGTGLTSIPEYAFGWNFDLREVTLPENVVFVGYNAFGEQVKVTALNPDCHFETEEAFILRTGEEPWW